MLPNGRNEYRLTESNGIRMGLGLRWRSEQSLQRRGREHSLESGICCMNCFLCVYPTSLDKRGSLRKHPRHINFVCLFVQLYQGMEPSAPTRQSNVRPLGYNPSPQLHLKPLSFLTHIYLGGGAGSDISQGYMKSCKVLLIFKYIDGAIFKHQIPSF